MEGAHEVYAPRSMSNQKCFTAAEEWRLSSTSYRPAGGRHVATKPVQAAAGQQA